jgi:predicted transcriptional regulator
MSALMNTAQVEKPYLLEVLNDYLEVEKNIEKIILSTGYRNEHIAKKLKLPMSTYYMKKKKKTFAAKEVYQIVNMLDDEMYNAAELELIKSRKDDEVISSDEFIKQLTATMQ